MRRIITNRWIDEAGVEPETQRIVFYCPAYQRWTMYIARLSAFLPSHPGWTLSFLIQNAEIVFFVVYLNIGEINQAEGLVLSIMPPDLISENATNLVYQRRQSGGTSPVASQRFLCQSSERWTRNQCWFNAGLSLAQIAIANVVKLWKCSMLCQGIMVMIYIH